MFLALYLVEFAQEEFRDAEEAKSLLAQVPLDFENRYVAIAKIRIGIMEGVNETLQRDRSHWGLYLPLMTAYSGDVQGASSQLQVFVDFKLTEPYLRIKNELLSLAK